MLNTHPAARGWAGVDSEVETWIRPQDIDGEIPRDLNGSFFRNGPGIDAVYGRKLIHPIDGDGLIARLSFENGRAHLVSRFVATRQRDEEAHAHKMLFVGQMGSQPKPRLQLWFDAARCVVRGMPPSLRWRNPSNTNVFYWGGKLLSCYETRLPYELDPSTLETKGEFNLGGALELKAMAAHVRIDPSSQRLIVASHRMSLGRPGTVRFYEVDTGWNLCSTLAPNLPELNYLHDFALTPRYIVVHATPFVGFSKSFGFRFATGQTSPDELMRYHPELPSAFFVIQRDDPTKVLRFDTDPFHIFHYGHAAELGSELVFNAVCLGPGFQMNFDQGLWLANASSAPGRFKELRLNLMDGSSKITDLGVDNAEFPTVHPFRHGQPCRYTYLMATQNRAEPLPFHDIVKCDSKTGQLSVYAADGAVGEPVFMPKLATLAQPFAGDEDEGYLIVQQYNYQRARSEFLILDAADIARGPLARIKLQHHLTFGFHGTFWPEVFPSRTPVA